MKDVDSQLIWEAYDGFETIEEINWKKYKSLAALAGASMLPAAKADADQSSNYMNHGDAAIQQIDKNFGKINFTPRDRRTGKQRMVPSGGKHAFTGSDLNMTKAEYYEMIESYNEAAKQLPASIKLYGDLLKGIDVFDNGEGMSIDDFLTDPRNQHMFEPGGQFANVEVGTLKKDYKRVIRRLLSVLRDAAPMVKELADFFTSLDRAGYIDWTK